MVVIVYVKYLRDSHQAEQFDQHQAQGPNVGMESSNHGLVEPKFSGFGCFVGDSIHLHGSIKAMKSNF